MAEAMVEEAMVEEAMGQGRREKRGVRARVCLWQYGGYISTTMIALM